MESPYYAIYVNDILAFARTIVVKFAAIAETQNAELKAIGYPLDETAPETWPYYRHLAGEYHPRDTLMTVRSMDTLETIDFTKENLSRHRATAREYQFGTRYYQDLVRRYPDQTDLIQGIIAPVDVDTAYNAEDGEILNYDVTYLETNETTLVPNLQDWLYRFVGRWYNGQYNLTDPLYLPGFLAQLYAQLPDQIQSLRLAACLTPQAHSFHIREYLASHGRLDQYLPYLTQRQTLWLYRNVRYLQRHVGRQSTFDTLVEHLLTDRGLPLAHYRIRHNVAEMPDNIYPEVELWKYPLNLGYNQTGIDTASVHTILDKERNLARYNAEVQAQTEETLPRHVRSSEFSVLPTKVLESEVIDRSHSGVRSLESVLINEWLYLSTHNRYSAYVNVPNPGTGNYMNLPVRDAFIVAFYAFWKARGVEYDTLPTPIAYEVLRDPVPTVDDLIANTDTRYVSPTLIAAITDRLTPLSEYIATESFYTAIERLHQEQLDAWALYSLQEHMWTRAYCESVVKQHFMHIRCPLTDAPVNPSVWLVEKGYGIADLSPLDLDQLFTDCVNAATGLDMASRKSLAEVQRAMLALMGQLTSYSVQFLRTINQTDYWYTAVPATRVGDVRTQTHTLMDTPHPLVNVQRVGGHVYNRVDLGEEHLLPTVGVGAREHNRIHLNMDVPLRARQSTYGRVALNVNTVSVRRATLTTSPADPEAPLGQYQYPADDDPWPNVYDD